MIESVQPCVAMIELDDERLERMRQEPLAAAPPETALQPVSFRAAARGEELQVEIETHAQRAVWNAENAA